MKSLSALMRFSLSRLVEMVLSRGLTMKSLSALMRFSLSRLVDMVLSRELTMKSLSALMRFSLSRLVDLHGTEQGADNEEPLSIDEVLIIKVS